MAVAEKTIAEKAFRNPERELAFKSLLGAVYVLAGLGIVFAGLPWLWSQAFTDVNPFLTGALLLIVDACVAVGLVLGGRYLEKSSAPPHGFRAGAFAVCVGVFLSVWITDWIGTLLAEQDLGGFGIFVTLMVEGGLIFAGTWLMLKPGFSHWLVGLEEHGWFHASSYKPNQGVRVRRGTLLALLLVGACGIFTMISHNVLGRDLYGTGNDWELRIPFTHELSEATGETYRAIPLMYQVHITLPLVLIVLLFWFSWRVVNWPVFADFLIATEAEMNKVSWTSRKRLFQDTVVVLVTVTLLTFFLFFVDIAWIQLLRGIGVLKVDLKAEQQKQQETAKW